MTDLYRVWPVGQPEPNTEPVRAYSEEHAGRRYIAEKMPRDGAWHQVQVRWFGPGCPIVIVGAYNRTP